MLMQIKKHCDRQIPVCRIENIRKYAEKIKSYAGVGVDFVDGDITIVYKK